MSAQLLPCLSLLQAAQSAAKTLQLLQEAVLLLPPLLRKAHLTHRLSWRENVMKTLLLNLPASQVGLRSLRNLLLRVAVEV